jgi:hypothetical protein
MRTVLRLIERLASGLHRSEQRRVAEYIERRRRDLVRRNAMRTGSD